MVSVGNAGIILGISLQATPLDTSQDQLLLKLVSSTNIFDQCTQTICIGNEFVSDSGKGALDTNSPCYTKLATIVPPPFDFFDSPFTTPPMEFTPPAQQPDECQPPQPAPNAAEQAVFALCLFQTKLHIYLYSDEVIKGFQLSVTCDGDPMSSMQITPNIGVAAESGFSVNSNGGSVIGVIFSGLPPTRRMYVDRALTLGVRVT